ncbi:MAG: DNA primase noncatalytic subunit PriX [Nitrososphaeraceae archaeon]|nr:DNA primase noncatalytic subunit PriX [Nitrososphaeraceae archaeon]
MTRKLGYQKEVFSREETLKYFQESDYLDCRINAFPSFTEYKGIQRYPPDLLFVDLDISTIPPLHEDLINTLRTIKLTFDSSKEVKPTVIMSGNGFHILQPIFCPEVLENIKEFQEYDNPSEELLRFAKQELSNDKADKNNHPSFKSCLLRIPGSINSKNGKVVKIVQKWNWYRPPAYNLLVEFKRYLRKKKVDDMISARYKTQESNLNNINPENYQWIEKLLETGIEDCRKLTLDLILAPYLVHIKKFTDKKSTETISEWLVKCNNVRRLDNNKSFNDRIDYALKSTLKKQIPPMSPTTIKSESRYQNLYRMLKDKGVLT